MLIFDKLMRLDSKSGRTNFYAVLHSIFSAIFEVAQGSTNSSHCHLMFQALINHGLSGIQAQLGCSVDFVMSAIEETINNFFMQALLLDTFTLRLEAGDEGD